MPRLDPLTRLINCAKHSQSRGRRVVSFSGNHNANPEKRPQRGGETYRGFAATRRTHDAVGLSEPTDRRKSTRGEGIG